MSDLIMPDFSKLRAIEILNAGGGGGAMPSLPKKRISQGELPSKATYPEESRHEYHHQEEVELTEEQQAEKEAVEQIHKHATALEAEERLEKEETEEKFKNYLFAVEELAGRSELLSSLNKSFFVPKSINRVHDFRTWVGVRGGVGDELIQQWSATNPEATFGSSDNYAQGMSDVPPQGDGQKTGRLENTILCRLTLSRISNNFPHPIGIRVGQMVVEEGMRTESFQALKNAEEVYENETYHAIIPAGFKSKSLTEELQIYRSTKTINHEWGERYPNVTASTVKDDASPNGKTAMYVKCRSPIADYMVKNFWKRGWRAPRFEQIPGHEDEYTVSKRDFEMVLPLVIEEIKQHLPIIDMHQFTIRFYSLNKDPDSIQLIKDWKEPYTKASVIAPSLGFSACLGGCLAFRNLGSSFVADDDSSDGGTY